MRLIAYKCDRCNQKIERRGQVIRIEVQDADYADLIGMDLCPECTNKLGGFLGLNEEFPFNGGDQDA